MDRAADLTAEELLAHADWLRGLARALVGDASADDVVQETYEVALSQRARARGALRPWLGGVARNLARMRRRAGERRARREEQVKAIAVAPPTPDELVARATVQHRIATLVLELEEPLRTTLMLRYYEGLSAADIARLQDVPAGTVRWRLKQAVDALRVRLDDEHGDRKRWALLLAPLAPPLAATSTAAPPGAGALVIKGVAVKTFAKLIALVAILALIVAGTRFAGLWGEHRSRAPAATAVDVRPPKPPADHPRAGGGGPVGASRTPVDRDDDPRGTLRLEGIVLDEHDQGVAGARVAIDAAPPVVVISESDGSFAFEGLIARDYRVEATAGDRYGTSARLRVTDRTELVTLRLWPGGAVEVTVADRDGGRPIAGAAVELRAPLAWTGVTGADGAVTLRGIGRIWAPLAVSAPGYAPAAVLVSAAGNPKLPERVAVLLGRGAAVAGRVVDDGGRPVAGARVSAALASEPFPVVDPRRDGVLTADDGGFVLPALGAGTYRLTASDGDHAPSSSAPFVVDGLRPRSGVELVMIAGGVVRGLVTDRAGQPVAAAEVQVVSRGRVDWRPRRRAFTGADGRFTITGLPRRAADVVAWHPTGASAVIAADLAARPAEQVTIVLDVTGAIEGTVVDAAGEPIGDALVTAERVDRNDADRASLQVRGAPQAVTDAGGRFRLSGLAGTDYLVRASRSTAPEDPWQAAGVAARAGGPPVRITLLADGGVTGKVALADGSAPGPFVVDVDDGPAILPSSTDGSFSAVAAAGQVIVRVAGPGFLAKEVEATIASGKETDLGTITVDAGRSISGRVLDAGGAPVAGATVAAGALLTGGGAELYIEKESIGARSAETDADGRYLLSGFPARSLTVVAGKAGVGRSISVPVAGGPASATVDLVLEAGGSAEGRVVKDGQPVADTPLIASPAGAMGSNFFVVTGPDGSFAFDFLAPGDYVTYPMMGGAGNRPKYLPMRLFTVDAGARASVTIDASTGPGTLAVTVTTDQGAPVLMAQVAAVGTHSPIEAPNMDALRDGSFLPPELRAGHTVMIVGGMAMAGPAQLTGLLPGSYQICVVALPVTDPSQARAAMETAGTLPIKCQPVEVGSAPQTVTVAVPAAWTQPPPAP